MWHLAIFVRPWPPKGKRALAIGWICKIERYFYFALIDTNAINAVVFSLFCFEKWIKLLGGCFSIQFKVLAQSQKNLSPNIRKSLYFRLLRLENISSSSSLYSVPISLVLSLFVPRRCKWVQIKSKDMHWVSKFSKFVWKFGRRECKWKIHIF